MRQDPAGTQPLPPRDSRITGQRQNVKFPDDSSKKAMFYNNYRTKSLAKMGMVADREKAEDSQEERGGPMKIKTEKNVPRAERDGKTGTK